MNEETDRDLALRRERSRMFWLVRVRQWELELAVCSDEARRAVLIEKIATADKWISWRGVVPRYLAANEPRAANGGAHDGRG